MATSVPPEQELQAVIAAREQDLLARLTINAPSVVAEALKFTLRMLDVEDKRYSVLIGKASSVLGQAGLAVGISSSILTGVLLKEGGELRARAPVLIVLLGIAVLLTLVLGVSAVVVAAKAVRVMETRELARDAILSTQELDRAHEAAGSTPEGDPAGDRQALQGYQRFLIVHAWNVREEVATRNETIAGRVGRAQGLFVWFVVSAAVACGLMGAIAFCPSPSSGASALAGPADGGASTVYLDAGSPGSGP